jgi:ribonuclease-3
LGYTFKNKHLLEQALTHASYNSNRHKNYERLEFLGDRILGVTVAKILYEGFPDEPEGKLSPRHMSLVCAETVAQVALILKLNNYIRAENNALKTNQNVLCDVAEAVIGAICIDSNMDEAMAFVKRNWQHFINYASKPQRDNKTELQEYAHRLKCGNPTYELVSKTGSEHEPVFCMAVVIGDRGRAEGVGSNKKIAEQAAAAALLEQLRKNHG